MSKSTRATAALDRAGVSYTLHAYAYDPAAERIGADAAQKLGVPPATVLKTLIAQVDGRPVCVLVPSDGEVSMKRLAAALPPKAAERLTGYHVGGISPFGHPRRIPTAIEAAALAQDVVFLNGGQRGLQVRLRPSDLAALLDAKVAPLLAESRART